MPNDGPGEPDFVVVGDKIISAGICLPGEGTTSEAEAQTRQPLFSHDVRGGEWRVWRWLSGGLRPVLAAEGSLLAVGEILQPHRGEPVDTGRRRMRVSIVDMRTGTIRARFVLPAGQLAFASANRLVLSIVTANGARAYSSKAGPTSSPLKESPLKRRNRIYRSWLYSTGGRRIADLGTFLGLPRVSHMHLLTEESTIAVRRIPGGTSSPVIGFNAPQRTLVGLAFRWPALVVEETTATVLPADEINCSTGYYSAPTPAFLQVIDLAEPRAYEPPPLPSPLVAQDLLGHCPRVAYGSG